MENQAWILRSFLAQLERLEALGEEALNDIAEEFARLKSESTKYRADKTYLTKTAEKQENVKKNRYKDIVPFEHSRVKLNFTTSKNDTDYINASFIKGASGVKEYIATQGPLPHTVTDFLRMLWEYNIKVVVMACREFEMGKKKCELYWSPTQEPAFVSGPFTVHCDSEENKGHYLTRTLRVTYRNSSRTLKQLHYVTWPDHGVPDSIPSILEMLDEMRCYQAHDDVPICIHCSAGCGRTGVLCVIDYTWNLLKKQMITPDFNIYELVKNMRTQRPSVVQTKEQYELVYRTIKLLFESYLQAVEAQAHRNEVTLDPSTIVPGDESTDLSEELDFLPQFQQILNKERDFFPHVLRDEDTQRDQQQWNNLQSLPDFPLTTQDLQEGPRTSPQCVELQIQEDEEIPSMNPPPSPTLTAAICQMVEDPYFDTPINSPSSEEAPADSSRGWTDFKAPSLSVNDQAVEPNSPASGPDEEIPPPLPHRTPESYVVVVDTGCPGPCDRLIIPTKVTAEADRELGGCPPSPVPPLPERTPQSFELADSASVEQELKVNRSRIGTSSEWCGNLEPAAAAPHSEKESFARSRSLKAKMTFTVVPVAHPDPPLSSHPHSSCPPLDLLTPPLTSQAEESLAAHLPHRTRDSFILTTEDDPLQTTHPSPMVGSSSKWDDASRPKKFLDAVKSRSKSVRAKSQRPESLHATEQLASVPVVTLEGGSAQVNSSHNPPLTAETPENKSNKSPEKAMSRAMSLKIFRKKPKIAPPPPPAAQPRTPPAERVSSSVFKFGFGNRFGKPKGPRRYPETWN